MVAPPACKPPLAPECCPVCRALDPPFFMTINGQAYWRCTHCEARFLGSRHWLSEEEERAHYLTHENDPYDLGYRRFLSKLAVPLLEKLEPSLRGLDFGSGTGPALAAMLTKAGHSMATFDPFFAREANVLEEVYDFITCTEVLEHLHHPAEVLDRFDRLLAPGGWLAVMTCFQTDDARFANWHYRKEPTHVVFYREATVRLIAQKRGWTCEIPIKDVALMRKAVD